MKLSVLTIPVIAAYKSLTFKQLQRIFKDGSRELISWGEGGTDDLRVFHDHNLCPSLRAPKGTQGLYCDGSSCALDCKGGYTPVGNFQTKCKKDPNKKGFIWRRKLGHCSTCEPMPTFKDKHLTKQCYIDPKKNRKTCNFSCKNGAKFEGTKSVQCKCKGRKRQGECNWVFNGRKPVTKWNQKCTGAKPWTPPPGHKYCYQKPQQCVDVTFGTSFYNSWTCRNCIRLRSYYTLPDFFDNRDHMIFEFSEPILFEKAAHPVLKATKASKDMKKWIIEFSSEAQFTNRQMDFDSEWRSLHIWSKLKKAKACPCKPRIS